MLLGEEILGGVLLLTNLSRGSMGTGFMFADTTLPNVGDGEGSPVYLVTCAHVIADGAGISETRIALNLPEGGRDSWIARKNNWTVTDEWEEWTKELGPNWWLGREYDAQSHTHGDIAVLAVPKAEEGSRWNNAVDTAIKDIFSSGQSFGKGRINAEGVTEGHEVLVMGYAPGGYSTTENWPLVRRGAIGQITPYKRGLTESLVLDAGIFEGTSGGPVMLLPTTIARGGNPIQQGGLLGMVCGTSYRHSPMGWVEGTTTTGRVRIPIERQHIGVGYIAPVEAILKTTRKADGRKRKP